MENIQEIKANIFAYIFKLSNSLQVYLDNELNDDGLTAKQFFLMIVIDSFGENYPTFKQTADVGGSSYQNVKQISMKLERNGYLKIEDDEDDKRAKRLILTNKSRNYWQSRDLDDVKSLNLLFEDFNNEELNNFFKYLIKLIEGVKRIEAKQ